MIGINMGCDIKAFIEYSFAEPDGSKGFGYWNMVPLDRNYLLFAFMAGVRNQFKVEPVHLPKGIPQNLSDFVQDQYDDDCERYYACENHSHSWLSLSELEEVQRRYQEFGNYESDLLLDIIIAAMRVLEKNGTEESRLVFWFDN